MVCPPYRQKNKKLELNCVKLRNHPAFSLTLLGKARASPNSMSTPFTIYSYPGSFRTAKALIAAQYYGIPVRMAEGFQMGVTNKAPEFLAKNPSGKVPVLETPEGCVYESHAIARMFARARPLGCNVFLYGRTDLEAAQVDQWLDFIQTEMDSHIMQWIGQIHGFVQYNPKFLQEAKKNVKTVLQIPEKHLLAHTFLVGERLTLADICLACELVGIFTEVYDEEARRSFPNLTRWFLTCVNQPQFKAVLGEVTLCTVAKEPAKPAKKEKEGEKEGEEKKGEEKKEKKPAPKPKEEKPKKEEKKVEEEEEEEPKEEKKKNPLDLLPPSPFALEWWKRRFANARPEDMPAVCQESVIHFSAQSQCFNTIFRPNLDSGRSTTKTVVRVIACTLLSSSTPTSTPCPSASSTCLGASSSAWSPSTSTLSVALTSMAMRRTTPSSRCGSSVARQSRPR